MTERQVFNIGDNANKLDELLHDEWFNIESVKYSSDEKMLTIPFAKVQYEERRIISNYLIYRKYVAPLTRGYLHIHDVKVYEVIDKSKIGTYSFDKVTFPSDNSIQITTGQDLIITASGESLKIYVDMTDEVVGKQEFSYFLCLESENSPHFMNGKC